MTELPRRKFLKLASLPASLTLLGLNPSRIAVLAAVQSIKITSVEARLLEGGKCFVIVRSSEGIHGYRRSKPDEQPGRSPADFRYLRTDAGRHEPAGYRTVLG